ncbi:MAG: Nif3-like dinuclear metal center hexameric protein [Gammaproteobacteria bacterium]|nr:Nif3-like dinuclear metal center hexameric protein [Gammaproteobacteria bacterium]
MVHLKELETYLNTLLAVEQFRDYSPNGLQVEGRGEVKKIILGVTACQALIDAAIEAQADAILVHHGYFWKGEAEAVVGIKKQRLKSLLQADISLLAYHLPLDAHPELGNNAQLAKLLGLEIKGSFPDSDKSAVGMHGQLPKPMSAADFCHRIEQVLGRVPLHIAGSDKPIKTLAWCSGGAQGYIEKAAELGVDAYLSGEISEPTVHIAREYGLHYFAAGHHATECYGIQALGHHLRKNLALEAVFVDIENPV